MDQYAPLRFGARTWIVPWNHALPAEADAPDAAVVRLDPRLAFGSGTHPTTPLCLQWPAQPAPRRTRPGRHLPDFSVSRGQNGHAIGCESGCEERVNSGDA